MFVNPCDSVGGNLAFIPHLYDRWERQFIRGHLPRGGVFVDVGSNIGAYSLWAALHVGRSGKVVAIEAEKENYSDLLKNITLNEFCDIIKTFHVGVSDSQETLSLRRDLSCNRGGHTFIGGGEDGERVQCYPLIEIIKRAEIKKIDILKMDIEGFEEKVLTRYFEDVPRNSPLRPNYILVEVFYGPLMGVPKDQLRELICSHGYDFVREHRAGNALFEKQQRTIVGAA
jgi:FkbM family methyltransferase